MIWNSSFLWGRGKRIGSSYIYWVNRYCVAQIFLTPTTFVCLPYQFLRLMCQYLQNMPVELLNSPWKSISFSCVFRYIHMANCDIVSFLRICETLTHLSLTLQYVLPHSQLLFYWENRQPERLPTFFLYQICQIICCGTYLPFCHKKWLPTSPKADNHRSKEHTDLPL